MKRFTPALFLMVLLFSGRALYAQEHVLQVQPAQVQEALAQQKKRAAGQLKSDAGRYKNKVLGPYREPVQQGKQGVKSLYTSRLELVRQLFSFNRDSVAALRLPPLVKLSGGQVSLTRQVGRREGAYPAQSPVSFTRFAFNGGVQVLGLPLQLHALYSTEQHAERQPMNRIGVSFDAERLRQTLRSRIDQRIRSLERITNTDDLKQLERLYQFYERNDLHVPDGNELARYAAGLGGLDSLRNLPGQQVQAARNALESGVRRREKQYRQRLREKTDSVRAVAVARKDVAVRKAAGNVSRRTRRRDGAGETTGDTAARSRLAYDPKVAQRIEQYLKKEKISWDDLRHWQRKRDSLRGQDFGQLLTYEELMALKAVREKDMAQGLEVLRKFGLFGGPAGLLGTVKSVSVGTSYPHFTKYTLREVAINGLSVELQPGPLYVAYAGAKNQVAVPSQLTYARRLQAGRIGVGQKDGNHLYVNLLYGRDNEHSFRGDSLISGLVDTSFYGKPRENYVLGTDFRLQLRKGLALTGEWAHSVTAMNTYENRVLPGRLGAFLLTSSPDTSNVQVGQALAVGLQTRVGRSTTVSLRGERIGAGYYSLGAPYLRNDLMGYEVQVEQQLFKRRLVLSPQYGRWQDNLSGMRAGTGTMETYSLKSRLALPKMPYVVVQYLRNQVLSPSVTSLVTTANLSTGYHYQLGSLNAQSALVATRQRQTLLRSDSTLHAVVNNLTGTQTLNFSSPFSASMNASYMSATGVAAAGNWLTGGLTLSYKFGGVLQTSAGFLEGNNQQDGNRQNRFAEMRLSLDKWGDLALRGEQNVLRVNDARFNYRERFCNLTWSARF